MSLFFQDEKYASVEFPWLNINIKNINYMADASTWVKLVIINSGSVNATINGKSHTAQAGDMLLILPGEIHSFVSDSSDVIIVNIPCNGDNDDTDIYKCISTTPIIKGSSALSRELRDYIGIITKELSNRNPGYSYMAKGIAGVLVSSLINSRVIRELTQDELKKQEAESSLLITVKKYIKESYKENISLESTSAHCNLSLFYFSHLFKRITGVTFYDYLTSYRLDKALDMLFESKKILNVASECGFATVRTFNRSFKSFFGCSPSEYLSSNK
ncbi:MAG: AraC family transcriptional regulator [Clostridia bacterium]|nr:AraC family transcriptional regulator [Clostridia bacterium]